MAINLQTIVDGAKTAVIKVTGSGAATYTIVDPSTLKPAAKRVAVERLQYDLPSATSLELAWDATAAVNIMSLNPGAGNDLNFSHFGGLTNNAGAGVTGKITMTVTGTGELSLIITVRKLDPTREA